jgi:hypothetical protein
MFYPTQVSITKSIVSLVVMASISSAQNSIIGLPAAGSTVTKGGNVIVQLQRPVCCIRVMLNAEREEI